MAGAGNKLFTSGSILTASDVNTYLMDQTIMRFTSTTTRDAAFGGAGEATLAEGMFAYTTDTNTLWLYDGSNWVNVLGSDIGAQALSNRNVIINGAMQVAQRGTSSAGITTSAAVQYSTTDRFGTFLDGLGVWTQSLEADAPTGSGFRNSLKMICTTADASPAAGDLLIIRQNLEGQNVQQFAKGTASAKPFAISFWVKSNVTGTYIAELRDLDNTRSVSASYTIAVSATWEKKTITFPADTTGALDNDNLGSLQLNFGLGAGSTFTSGTLATTWASVTNANRYVGQTNLAATLNNYWQVTGVQLEAGSVATPFEFEDYGITLQKCKRYYWRVSPTGSNQMIGHGTFFSASEFQIGFNCPVTMRTIPTLNATTNADYFGAYKEASLDALTASAMNVYSSPIVFGVNFTGGAGTIGQSLLLISNNASAFMAVSAEL